MAMSPIIAALLAIMFAAGPQEDLRVQRIITASNVRLRAAPQTNADIVATLSLGTVVTELEGSMDAAWYRVHAPDGKTGWVFGSLTEPFSDRESIAVYGRILRSRLQPEPLRFSEASELFLVAERVAPQVQGPARAEFDLFRLRALKRSLDEIMWEEPKDPGHQDWIRKHDQDLIYSEPAGQWLVRGDLYWELETRHRGNPIADEIAWEGATAGIPGECEGYIPCHMAVLLQSVARYLDLYPNGSHMAEALEDIDYLLEEALKPNTPYFMDSREAMELRESVAKMGRILERTSSPKKAEMLERLKRIEQTYR